MFFEFLILYFICTIHDEKTVFLFVIILFHSCNQQREADDTPPELLLQPHTYPLNPQSGNRSLPEGSNSIQPVLNSFGDTLITGVPVPMQGRIINSDSIRQPKAVLTGKGRSINAHPNVYELPDQLTVIGIDPSSLIRIAIPEIPDDDTLHYILNSTGQQVKTGVPVSVKGTRVNAAQPKMIPALLPQMKYDAIYNIQSLDVDQGMNCSYVASVIEDRAGNIWFGTVGGGVTRYDGCTFEYYTEKQGLSKIVVHAIIQDHSGQLWFGTREGGITKYDGKNFIQFKEEEGFSNNIIDAIIEDREQNIWFGTRGGGVAKYDGNYFTYYTVNEGLLHNAVYSLLQDHSGNIWMGTKAGISMYDGKSFTHFTEKEGLCNDVVHAICEDRLGNLWFGTNDGVTKYNGKSFTNYTTKEGLSDNEINCISEDRSGNLWFGTRDGGVNKFDGKRFTHYTEKEGLTHNEIMNILEDRSGNLWFGTRGGGVNKYNRRAFTHFTEAHGLGWVVWSVLEDRSGNIWFGTRGGGVAKYDGKHFTYYTEEDGLGSNFIFSILEDHSGNIWFGTRGGGATKYNGKSFTNYTTKEGLSDNTITCISEDHSGNIWFASQTAGVSKYDGKFITHYTGKEGFTNYPVLAIMEDAEQNLWFGTEGSGVIRFDGEVFMQITEEEGLSSNYVYSILEERRDSLSGAWLGTEKGLDYIVLTAYNDERRQTHPVKQVVKFEKEDGLRALDFIPGCALIDRKGYAWWGSGKGMERLDLEKFKLSDVAPEARLTQLDINENVIDFRNLHDSLKQQIVFDSVAAFENYPLHLSVPYDKNHLTFHFVATDWNAPNKINYQYQLKGLDENWSEVTKINRADYRNIPPGTYTFRVRATGESLQWGEPFTFVFTILPPWWQTVWFRIIYISTGIIMLILLFRWRTASLRRQKLLLEHTVQERTQEIVQQKEIIETKHKEITDSINYAERIQRSFLATKKLLDENLNDYVVFYKPKDVVSGDFYWASKLNNGNFAYACADSTGHGVPGAIMSILNISSLEKSIETNNSPAGILSETRKIIIERLKKDGSAEGGKDGMDASLIILNKEKTKLRYAAANNSVWILRHNEVIELTPDKMPVGKHDKDQIPFTEHEVILHKGDLIYSFTDGMPDQFGGPKGKKYKYTQLKTFLISVSNLPMQQQMEKLEAEFIHWKGDLEQVDDVCIIGVRI